MKIAIHNRKGSFSEQWIAHCEEKQIPYKTVNCYDSDIVRQLEDCDALMWHHHHGKYKDVLFAKQLMYSLEQAGKKVFPNFHTCWHFDDKVGQKYLLESIQAPLVPSYVFYDKKEALAWIQSADFPKVFKLRNGAGASNVKLIKSKREAIAMVNTAFGKGFKNCDYLGLAIDSFKKMLRKKAVFRDVVKYIALYLFPSKFNVDFLPKQKGYVYFQDFIPGNEYDIRLIVIGGKKAYGLKRMVRKGDFRASGSEEFVYDSIDNEILKTAFYVSKKLKLQTVAFDFIYKNKKNLIVEISCFYGTKGSGKCTGYWTDDLVWHQEQFNPYGWMVENLIK